MGERGEAEKLETHGQLFNILQALNRDSGSSVIKASAELGTASGSIISEKALPFSLSQHLSQLADELHRSKPSRRGLISLVARRVWSHEVSRLATKIESELLALIDLETVSNLTKTLSAVRTCSSPTSLEEEKLLDQMSVLQDRLSRGFDINFQDLLLKSGVFAELEWVLCSPVFSKRVREKAAVSIKELVLFNKDVFVGSFVVGGSAKVLALMASLCSLQILSSLIKAIRSPLVDEMDSSGAIFKIVGYLSSSGEMEIRVMALECVMEIGYFGRKEAIEAMLNGGLIRNLVELQRYNYEAIRKVENNNVVIWNGKLEMKHHPFERCVARFAVQLEVGEGLRQREKRAFKQLILSKVREVCDSDAECATIVAEVLWGSSP